MNLVTPPNQIISMDGRPLNTPPRRVLFSEENDAKEMARQALGDLDDIELFFNDVLVLKYIRSNLSENLIASADTQREDKYQNGIGLVLKVGPRAFQDTEHDKFYGLKVEPYKDWVMYRISDGWDRDVQELYGLHKFANCRLIQDAHIRARVRFPARFNAVG